MAYNRHTTAGSYRALTVTPSDSTNLETTRAIYVGTTGNLAVTMADGQVVTFTAAAVGYHPLQVTKIMATNTTAGSLLALY